MKTEPTKEQIDLSANAAVANTERKWTEWSVVGVGDGTLRCKRTNVEDEKDAEYRQVPRPVFGPEELAAMIEFGSYELIPRNEIASRCYEVRYRSLAFHLCSELNAVPNGAK